MSNEVADDYNKQVLQQQIELMIGGKKYTKKEISELATVMGHTESWVRQQLGLPTTRWQKFNNWRRRLVSNKYYKMFDWVFMMTLLLGNVWFIGAGCGKEEVWKDAVKEGVAVKEGKTYKWKTPNAEQAPIDGVSETK